MESSLKRCSGCKIEKDREEFAKNRSMKDGHQHQCRECAAQAQARWYADGGKQVRTKYDRSERGRAAQARYRQTERGKQVQAKANAQWYLNGGKQVRAKLNMKKNFGDARLKDFLFQYQGGLSALSGLPLLAPAIDHCHKTDKVRGLINDLENCRLSWWTGDCLEGAHEALRKLKKQDGVKAQFLHQAIQYLQRTPEQIGVEFIVVGRYASLKRSKREATKLREQNTINLNAAIERMDAVLEQVA